MSRAHSDKRAIVLHPQSQHSIQSARALEEAGLLDVFATAFVFRPEAFPFSLLSFAPSWLRNKVHSILLMRRLGGLAEQKVRGLVPGSLFANSISRFGIAPGRMRAWVERSFVSRAAALIRWRNPDLVLCFDDTALELFRAAETIGARKILDQTTGHLTQAISLYREEDRLWPQFAGSYPEEPEEKLQAAKAELLLADCVLCPSEYVQQTVLASGVAKEKTRLLPYGVDTELFRPQPRTEHAAFRICYAGRIASRKGVQYLLEAFTQLPFADKELHLYGAMLGDWSALLAKQKNIYHHEMLPRQLLATELAKADVFVFPSIHEGSSLVVYEALACGLPVIATANSGAVFEDGVEGFIVPIRQPEAIAEKLSALYEDPALRSRMADAARKKALEHTWAAYRTALARIIAAEMNA